MIVQDVVIYLFTCGSQVDSQEKYNKIATAENA